MKKIIAIALTLVSSNAYANDWNGVWATKTELCKKEWVRIKPNLFTGPDWNCRVVELKEVRNQKLVTAFCGYDRTDVTFDDLIMMTIEGNTLTFEFVNHQSFYKNNSVKFKKCR